MECRFEAGGLTLDNRPTEFCLVAHAVVITLASADLMPEPLLKLIVMAMWDPTIRVTNKLTL